MKKVLALVVATVMALAMFMYWLTPVQPTSFQLHVVRGGETINSIVQDANKDSMVDYDLREAAATAVAESKKMEGGANSYTIYPGQKVAVPIYK